MEKLVRACLLAGFAISLQSCYYLQSAREPLSLIHYPFSGIDESSTDERPKDLMVLLPGIGDYPDQFQRHAFIADLREQKLPVDAVAVNAHIGYYTERNLLIRLKWDVVEPAFAQGYERIHFVGVSLGGYGTLLYMRSHPDDVASAILLAPYLGEPEHYHYLRDVAGSGEPAQGEENIWPWLEQLPDEALGKIYLGYGRSDQYADSHQLLASLLPQEHSLAITGGHTWSTWQLIWPQLLSRSESLQSEVELARR